MKGRLAEVDRLAPGWRPDSARFWDRRAPTFARTWSCDDARGDPFLRRLKQVTRRTGTVLDVGCGAGRFALSLAPRVRSVTAVDVSPAMLRALRRRGREAGITNVATVAGLWPDVEVARHDVVFSAFVLPLVVDAARFLRRLEATATERVLLYLGAFSNDVILDPLWRHFHDKPRRPGATYLDALAVLREMGIRPEVEVVEVPFRAHFNDLGSAVKEYRELLLLPDTAASRRELRELLAHWLVPRRGGLAPPVSTVAAAIISWEPSQRHG